MPFSFSLRIFAFFRPGINIRIEQKKIISDDPNVVHKAADRNLIVKE